MDRMRAGKPEHRWAHLRSPIFWLRSLVTTVLLMAFTAEHPVERLLRQPYDPRHWMIWEDCLAWLTMMVLFRWTWDRLFRRRQREAERAWIRTELLAGHFKRMPFMIRTVAMLTSLLSLLFGEWTRPAPIPALSPALWIGGGVFVLLVLQETVILLFPGESLHVDTNDELRTFFSARVLRTGFRLAVLGLIGLTILALFQPALLAPAIPVWLALCVFVPGFQLHRHEQEADVG